MIETFARFCFARVRYSVRPTNSCRVVSSVVLTTYTRPSQGAHGVFGSMVDTRRMRRPHPTLGGGAASCIVLLTVRLWSSVPTGAAVPQDRRIPPVDGGRAANVAKLERVKRTCCEDAHGTETYSAQCHQTVQATGHDAQPAHMHARLSQSTLRRRNQSSHTITPHNNSNTHAVLLFTSTPSKCGNQVAARPRIKRVRKKACRPPLDGRGGNGGRHGPQPVELRKVTPVDLHIL